MGEIKYHNEDGYRKMALCRLVTMLKNFESTSLLYVIRTKSSNAVGCIIHNFHHYPIPLTFATLNIYLFFFAILIDRFVFS